MKIGHLIKQARKEAHLTQEQLGIKCGWDEGNPQSRIGNYERDVRNTTASDLAIIAEATGKPITFFYPQTLSETPSSPAAAAIDTKHLEKVIQKIELIIQDNNIQLTPEQKAKAISACISLTDANTPPDTSHILVALRAVS